MCYSLLFFFYGCSALTGLPAPDTDELKRLKVIEIVDGDDVILSDKSRVRLIGIDAPETYPGKNAEPQRGTGNRFDNKGPVHKVRGSETRRRSRTVVDGELRE